MTNQDVPSGKRKFTPGETVRYVIDGQIGQITGNCRGTRWEVNFGMAVRLFIQEMHLQPVAADVSIHEKFNQRAFLGIEDFRKVFSRIRLSGELTNLMYSMGNKQTQFLPHQFVPVLKFLSADQGRLLIADEVGLGKTIEAMYIWQELRARDNACRLLIVAPAILKDKWLKDVSVYFNIDLFPVSADTLLKTLERGPRRPFATLASLQGLRGNEELLEWLEGREADDPVFDLVIVDEAHYLRNEQTRSYRLGEALRSTSRNLLLLSATPIQTGAKNFFNLLRLLEPGEFRNENEFNRMLYEFRPLVRLTNAVDRRESSETIRAELNCARQAPPLAKDRDLLNLEGNLEMLAAGGEESAEHRKTRLRLVENLKAKYFYAPFVTRMRKRDVFEHRATRHVATIAFDLSDIEKRFYDAVTEYLLQQEEDYRLDDDFQRIFFTFLLIARQRQIASCMPAALRTWREETCVADWDENGEDNVEDFEFSGDLANGRRVPMPGFDDFDLDELERADTKFREVLSTIRQILQNDPAEKIVVFSFFRGTVKYLTARFKRCGIAAESILGGLSPGEKAARLDRFRTGDANILVSSEVGSEGIDLQFSRTEINYDLPWNPMRVEQRIGRIDRIGQKSPDLYIYNAFCSSTIEDRVLQRLHERIRLFEDVLGDVEEILGPTIRNFELETFLHGRELTEEDIARMMDEIGDIRERNAALSEDISNRSGMLSEYQQYVLDGIRKSRRNNRLVTDFELRFLVKEFLNSCYPGASVAEGPERGISLVALSQDARGALKRFIDANPGMERTTLSIATGPVACAFGSIPKGFAGNAEAIGINHALVRMMVSELKGRHLGSGCNSLAVSASEVRDMGLSCGLYVYYVQQWISKGIGRVNELHYFVRKVGSGDVLPDEKAECLLTTALLKGKSADCPRDVLPGGILEQSVNMAADTLYDFGWEAEEAFEAERKSFDEDKKTNGLPMCAAHAGNAKKNWRK